VNAPQKAKSASNDVLCLIPARKGSRGIPGKNTKLFMGKPLIYWTLTCAIDSGIFAEIAVTTDDEIVKDISNSLGVTVIDRPNLLAKDSSLASEYLSYHQNVLLKYRNMMLLQPTSPLRNIFDIQECYRILESGSDRDHTVVSVVRSLSTPRNLLVINKEGFAQPIFKLPELNRQEQDTLYLANGAFFASKTKLLKELNFDFFGGFIVPYIMPVERSVDIDTLEDFKGAEEIFERRPTK
jgi:CMP-N-acetylneuraminic acid synthetase